MMDRPLPEEQLREVCAATPFERFRDARIFVTGGTGFFGHWLLESLLQANRERSLGVQVTVLTRDAAAFSARSPQICADAAIALLQGDVASFDFSGLAPTHILHAATDSVVQTTEAALAQSIVAGTKQVLKLASQTDGPVRLLYVSSGAVYGRGVSDVVRIEESYPLPAQMGAEPVNYDEAKRACEALCLSAGTEQVRVAVARCFAFVGPHLPLDAHFAVGNFIRDALSGNPILIKGDGTPLRSFLYMSDLATWLWTMLAKAPAGMVLNVGSDEAVSITELARVVAEEVRPGLAVNVAGRPGPSVSTYVPDVAAAQAWGLRRTVGLRQAVRRTAEWYRG